MEEEKIMLMAVAAIAEETHVDTKCIVVRSFRQVRKSGLEKYAQDHGFTYHQYRLEDARA